MPRQQGWIESSNQSFGRQPRADNTGVNKTPLDEKTARLTTLLTMVAVIFIVCLLPGVLAAVVNFFVPEFDLNKRYHDVCAVVYGLGFTLPTFSASANIFVYITMSTRFRSVFLSLLPFYTTRAAVRGNQHLPPSNITKDVISASTQDTEQVSVVQSH